MTSAGGANTQKIVVLDRDGVINADSDDYIKSPQEWVAIPGSLEAIARLQQSGYKIAIATNQSGVGRGLYTLETLDAIHAKMAAALAEHGATVDVIAFCPHTPADDCACRKPRPGLLCSIEDSLNVDLSGVPFIGDSRRDLDAAVAKGMAPVLVKTGKGTDTAAGDLPLGTTVYEDLRRAVDAILA